MKIKNLTKDLSYEEIKKRKWRTPRTWKNNKKLIFFNYIISNDGIILRKTGGTGTYTGKKISSRINRYGYARSILYIDGRLHTIFLHRLLWETWIGRIPKGLQINHKDGIKTNNNFKNLEIVTPKENTQHAIKNGLNLTESHIKAIIKKNKERKHSEETKKRIGKGVKKAFAKKAFAKKALHQQIHTIL
jgi:hypothetical protein